MNKTVSKYPQNIRHEANDRIQKFANFVTHESKQSFNTLPNDNFQESMDFGDETKRRNMMTTNSSSILLTEELNALRK